MFLALEFCLVVVAIALALMRPMGDRWFMAAERRFSDFAQNRLRAVLFTGTAALVIRLALLPILHIPQPEVTDEFSYLLSADTFAHGRLTNPTHPMWRHFETFQEIWRPTYSSMYYPGYGLFLAVGQKVLGHPFWGVWLSVGLMCGAICWALQGWMPPGWALLGGLMAMVRLGTFSYWADSYWGGTVAAMGGALVVGALPRIRESHRSRDAWLLGVGMALLLYTRPYEGLFFCMPIIGVLVMRDWKAISRPQWIKRVAIPACAVLVSAFAGLGYFFWRVTGSPFTTPYQVNMRTYGLVYFPWEKPTAASGFIRAIFPDGPSAGWLYDALHHPVRLQVMKVLVVWLFYFGPLLTLPWLAWLATRRKAGPPFLSAELRILLAVCLSVYLGSALTIYTGQPHYVAPLAAVFYVITLLMLRDLYHLNAQTRFIARCVPVICVVLFLARAAAPLVNQTPAPSWIRTWCSQDEQNLHRAKLLAQLEHAPGKQLAIVRYQPHHDFILDEWVYNRADVDGSKVVWARDMGAENEELLEYFKDRRAWLVEPDDHPPKVTPYER